MMSGASNQAAAGPQGMSSLLQAYVCLFVATGIEKDFFGSLTAFWYMERLWLNPFNVDPDSRENSGVENWKIVPQQTIPNYPVICQGLCIAVKKINQSKQIYIALCMGVTPGGVRGVATPPHYEVRGLLMYSNPPELEEI